MENRNIILEDEIEKISNEINNIDQELADTKRTCLIILYLILGAELTVGGYFINKTKQELNAHKLVDIPEDDELNDENQDLTINDDMVLTDDNVIKVKKIRR